MTNKTKLYISIFLVACLTASCGSNEKNNEINSKEKYSPSELLKRRREKLEERNKNMVEKKIEDINPRNSITDGCNTSPYSNSCTLGPNTPNYLNHATQVQPVGISERRIEEYKVEELQDKKED